MNTRGKWQGMLTIAEFNWPFYIAVVVALVASFAGLLRFSGVTRLISGAAFAGAAYFLFGSLGVSHLIYDCSDLYRWDWLRRALKDTKIRQAIFCHSGFDETSIALREKLPQVEWQVLDHFDEPTMTEASIRRARAKFPPTQGTLPARYDAWPTASESADLVIGLLAIHELRSEAKRSAWFAESKRCLRKDGRVILVEHVRDAANFVAFGPGFLHFHSIASWRRCWTSAGLRTMDEFKVTPFVRVFVLSLP